MPKPKTIQAFLAISDAHTFNQTWGALTQIFPSLPPAKMLIQSASDQKREAFPEWLFDAQQKRGQAFVNATDPPLTPHKNQAAELPEPLRAVDFITFTRGHSVTFTKKEHVYIWTITFKNNRSINAAQTLRQALELLDLTRGVVCVEPKTGPYEILNPNQDPEADAALLAYLNKARNLLYP